MPDHPYAGPDTMTPGQVADDDPYSEKKLCRKCDDYVKMISDKNVCPNCGNEV
jgi:rRNA maturation endonuclease Nob1